MTRRQLMERRRRHQKIMRIRRIVKTAIYAFLILIAFLIIRFGIVPLFTKERPKKAVAEESVPETAFEASFDGNTAHTNFLAASTAGETGWNVDNTGWYYKLPTGAQYTGGWQTIDGQKYYFGEDGYLTTGWQTIDGEDHYFNRCGIEEPGAKRKLIALTYDDGPSENTQRILNTLDKYNAKATFFVVGEMAEAFPELLVAERDDGMEIANHTYSHENLQGADEDLIVEQIGEADEWISAATGSETELLRPPYGAVDDVVREVAGKPLILWSIDSLDWESRDAQSVYDIVKDSHYDGAIILMHDLYESTAEATEMVVPMLAEAGYKMVTVSEMAKAYGISLRDGATYFDMVMEG